MSTHPSVSGRGTRRGFTLAAALIGFSALAGSASASPSFLQEGSPKPPPIFKPGSAEQEETELTKLVPGELPKDATPETIALWEKMVAATRTKVEGQPAAPVKPVKAFRLTFDLRWKKGTQSNDIPKAQLSYLSPGYVRTTLQSGRQLMRGPEGDFLVDGDRVDRIEGRESAEDRKQLDDIIRLAKNFLSLTNPNSLRIRVLEQSSAPGGLPKSHEDDAKKLDWLRIESPDFYLLRSDSVGSRRPLLGGANSSNIYSAKLGIDKVTGRVRQAEIVHLRETGNRRQAPLFISFDKFFSQEGFELPGNMFVYDIEEGFSPVEHTYQKVASSELYLRTKIENGLSLSPGLKPEDFLPPTAAK